MDTKKYNKIFLIGLFLILIQSVFAIPPTVTRDLPPSAAAGSTFIVTLKMDIDEGDVPIVCGVTENYPSGWTVSNISLGGINNVDRIEWLFWNMSSYTAKDQNITYNVTVPNNASGTATFSGVVYIGTIDNYTIIGDTQMTITGVTTTTSTTTTSTTTLSTTTTIDPCANVTCLPYCIGDIRVYDGVCQNGTCVYGSDELCTFGCSNGSCNPGPTTTTSTSTTISSTSTTTTTTSTSTTTSSTSTTTTTTSTSTTTSSTSTTTTTTSTSTTTTTSTTTSTTSTLSWEPLDVIGEGRGYSEGKLYEPMDVAVDSNGSIYVVERYNERVSRFDEYGNFIKTFGHGGDVELGEFDRPESLALREVNETTIQLFITDTYNYRVQIGKIDSSNKSYVNVTWLTFGERCYEDCKPWSIYFEQPKGIDLDTDGRIYVADTGNDRVLAFNFTDLDKAPSASNMSEINGSGSVHGLLNKPEGVDVSNGKIYVADTGNDIIRIFNLTGKEITSFGTTGSGNGEFRSPSSLALDDQGMIYVADTMNSRIQIFYSHGTYITEFGKENCSSKIYSEPEEAKGQFCKPKGIEIKGEKIYIADTDNHRVQVFEVQELSCALKGDYPVCGYVTLEEVIDFINLWDQDLADLEDVIDLINAWEVS